MSDIKDCIHQGEKTKLRVKYDGVEKTLSACPECYDVIKSSNLCKILEVLS